MNNTGFSPKLPLSNTKIHYDMLFDIEENIKQNIKNIVLTSPGERIMMPSFGVGVRRYLFELDKDTIAAEIEEALEDQLNNWMPFVSLENVAVLEKISGMSSSAMKMSIVISYSVPDLEINDELIINQ